MKKSLRLKVIVDLNAEHEKKALELLGKTQRKKQSIEEQLVNLQQYHLEYTGQLQSSSESGMSINKLLEFKAFISKLELAIEEQKILGFEIDNELIEVRKAWEVKHQKTRSIQKVRNSAVQNENKIEETREQKEQDERAMRVGRNNGTRNA